MADPDDRAPESQRTPGEVLPQGRRLARPPSDRYRPRTGEVIAERPRLARASLLGLLAAAGIALVFGTMHAILSVTAGLIALSALGGWLIGAAVRWGAWGGAFHRPSNAPPTLAAAIAIAAWVGGLVAAWLLSMTILPGSTRSFAERVAGTPFLEWVGPQLGPIQVLELALLVGVATVTAAARATTRTPGAGA
jgi:hypothetical protein